MDEFKAGGQANYADKAVNESGTVRPNPPRAFGATLPLKGRVTGHQSPMVAWITASAATAAVSARRMRGPNGIAVTKGRA